MNYAIIIVNWNSWALLLECITALSQQTYQDFQVFIADNHSDDPPPDWILSMRSDLKFVQYKHNYGFAKANNALIEQAKNSKWIVFLNPDTMPQKDWLQQLIKAAESFPQFSCFASRLLRADAPSTLDGDGDIYHVSGLAWRKSHARFVRAADDAPREIFSACAAAAMFRTAAVRKVGAFDEDFFCYFEDVDLGFRLRLAGYRTLLVPASMVYHHGSATSGGRHSNFAVYHGHRNMVWTYVKNMPGLLFWLFLPYHLLVNLSSLFWFAARGQGKVMLRAKKDAVSGLKLMWRKRRAIQNARKASLADILKLLDKLPIPGFERILRMCGFKNQGIF